MLSREEDVEAGALRAQGWSISAIARHLGRDRGTVRSYLNGERTPGVRRRTGEEGHDAEGDPQERVSDAQLRAELLQPPQAVVGAVRLHQVGPDRLFLEPL